MGDRGAGLGTPAKDWWCRARWLTGDGWRIGGNGETVNSNARGPKVS